jgi:hypothetical protein
MLWCPLNKILFCVISIYSQLISVNKFHWANEKQIICFIFEVKTSVIVHFNYFWSFRVFSGWTASGRPPTSFPTSQTLCKWKCSLPFSYTKTLRNLVATLKHNKREKKAFAQGLNGGTRSGRTPWGCLARGSARVPEVVKVNNYQDYFSCNWWFVNIFQ